MKQKLREKQIRNPFKDQYPQLNCYWDIYFGNLKVSATEVTGLKETIELIPYRVGNSTRSTTTVKVNRPQDRKIVVKWPVFTEGLNGAHIFQDWRDQCGSFGLRSSIDIVVTLLDEHQEPVMYWVCRDCNPTDYQGPELKGDKAEIAIQTLTLGTTSIKSHYVHSTPGTYANFIDVYRHQFLESVEKVSD